MIEGGRLQPALRMFIGADTKTVEGMEKPSAGCFDDGFLAGPATQEMACRFCCGAMPDFGTFPWVQRIDQRQRVMAGGGHLDIDANRRGACHGQPDRLAGVGDGEFDATTW